MLPDIRKNKETMYKMLFSMLLTTAGGFMDAYSYMVHGKVFATGQTGNLVLAGVSLLQGDYGHMFHALVPIGAFWLGVFAALHLFYLQKEERLPWKRGILLSEIAVLLLAGLLPLSFPDIFANILVSFAASLQFTAFRTFGTGGTYSSVFCTGNMRSCAENYYKGLIRKDRQCLKKAAGYSLILLSFFAGIAIGALASVFWREKAILSVCLLLITALALLSLTFPRTSPQLPDSD